MFQSYAVHHHIPPGFIEESIWMSYLKLNEHIYSFLLQKILSLDKDSQIHKKLKGREKQNLEFGMHLNYLTFEEKILEKINR